MKVEEELVSEPILGISEMGCSLQLKGNCFFLHLYAP